MKYVAQCGDCGAIGRFSDYQDRADWVGKHRVKTGHTVEMSEE